jgi:ATP-dependent DNA helicase RecG
MTTQELQKILEGESNSIEWKAGGDPEKIVKTLTAFANDYEEAGAGAVVCGVEEDRQPDGRIYPVIAGISTGESKRLRDRIFELSRILVNPPIEPRFESVPIDKDRELLVVSVIAGSEVHLFKNTAVVRLGDKVTNATPTQQSNLVLRKAHLNWLDQPCPGATLDDIDHFALAEVSRGRRPAGGVLALLQPGYQMFGSAPPFVSRVTGPRGEMDVPNRFAILLIGKEPQRFFPGAYIGFARFAGMTRAAAGFSSSEFFGAIPRLFEQLMDVLRAEASTIVDKTVGFGNGVQNRVRYSEQALREILVNALAHRDYRDPLSTKISVFDDRIEFESPGGLMNHGTIEEAKRGRTRWRNPSLARYLAELDLAQERGTGLPRAIEETKAVAGAEPLFDVDSWFKVTVPAYRPPVTQTLDTAVGAEAGALLISIGFGTIDPILVRRSHAAFASMSSDSILSYHHPGFLTGDQWPELIRELRNWLRDRMEDARFQEFHVFYRGPVAVGPMIGAMSVGRKPLVLYSYNEDAGLYLLAYRLDRRLLQEP